MAFKSPAKNTKLQTLDELFGLNDLADTTTPNDPGAKSIVVIPLSDLLPFKHHTYKVVDDADMAALAESITEKGVLTPLLVRPHENKYEIISGHRRHRAASLAGIESLPAIVADMEDDEAVINMVDSNLQREHILPSEKAFSYRIKLDAMNRQGQRTDITSSQNGTRLRSDQILAAQVGESRTQIQRYVRLSYLIPNILDMVDTDKIKLVPAVEVSYLNEDAQHILHTFMSHHKIQKISTDQAKLLRGSKDNITDDELADIFDVNNRTKDKKSDTITLKIPMECIPDQYRKTPPDGELLRRIEETIRNYYASDERSTNV